ALNRFLKQRLPSPTAALPASPQGTPFLWLPARSTPLSQRRPGAAICRNKSAWQTRPFSETFCVFFFCVFFYSLSASFILPSTIPKSEPPEPDSVFRSVLSLLWKA